MHEEISSSLASLWNNYSGSRPSEVSTTIRDSKVRCRLSGGVDAFDEALDLASKRDLATGERRLTMYTFRREAMEAVSRITHRRVLAFVSNHDQDKNVATEVFIIESPPAATRSIFEARQNLEA
jgi:uncharacterized protein YbcI